MSLLSPINSTPILVLPRKTDYTRGIKGYGRKKGLTIFCRWVLMLDCRQRIISTWSNAYSVSFLLTEALWYLVAFFCLGDSMEWKCLLCNRWRFIFNFLLCFWHKASQVDSNRFRGALIRCFQIEHVDPWPRSSLSSASMSKGGVNAVTVEVCCWW